MQTIVMIDDDMRNVEMLRAFTFATPDIQLVTAHTGRMGIQKVRDHEPIAVVIDYYLPGDMNGLDIVRWLRANPSLNHVPLVAMTATTELNEDIQRYKQSCDYILDKPFHLKSWTNLLENVLSASC